MRVRNESSVDSLFLDSRLRGNDGNISSWFLAKRENPIVVKKDRSLEAVRWMPLSLNTPESVLPLKRISRGVRGR